MTADNVHETPHPVDLTEWGADPRRVVEAGGRRLGRIVRVERGECDVITTQGPVRSLSDSTRAQSDLAPATGDWVILADGDAPRIDEILERRTTLARRDPGEQGVSQVLVTNVDTVGLVHGFDRPLAPGRLERSLVLVWASGAEPVVVLTKSDQVGPGGAVTEAAASELEATVRAVAPHVDVRRVSALTGDGIEALRRWIAPGRTTALLGESGSGKSTLVNRLLGVEVQATAEVRARDRKGRHTTITRDLLLLPGGGLVIDTPGIRAVGLWGGEEALAEVFADIEAMATSCRFIDCGHDTEPGCSVTGAIVAGDLDPRRLDRYRQMIVEIAELEARDDARARRRNQRSPG